jgi:hypothetical protein
MTDRGYAMEVPATKEIAMLDLTRLVLSRKVGQVFEVGDTKITIKKVRGDVVSVLIEAPRGVKVLRPDAKKGPKDPE